jgi:hypothetical protein
LFDPLDVPDPGFPEFHKEDTMDINETLNQIHRAVGRIECELDRIRELSQRVSSLELWQSWLKGAWAVLAAAFAYVFKISRP